MSAIAPLLMLLVFVCLMTSAAALPQSAAEEAALLRTTPHSRMRRRRQQQQQQQLQLQRGLVVIPGVGRADRLVTLSASLRLLESEYLSPKLRPHPQWDCIVYIYAMANETSFWAMRAELAYISSLCRTVEHTNRRVTENLYMVQPALIRHSYSHIFVLLDDCKLLPDPASEPPSFNLNKMLGLMRHNNLTIASPRVIGANVGGGQEFRTIMQARAAPGTEGYVSVFVEWFAWVMTAPAYQALWELLCPFVNPYGWGYDFWYDNYARTRVPGHRMGIISTVEVKHEQDVNMPGQGRTDNTKVETKWQSVLKQEAHYKAHLGIDLRQIRQRLALKNTSWNGAVTGFLAMPFPRRSVQRPEHLQ